MERRVPPKVSVVMAIISFVVAIIPAAGIVMKSDPAGRIIFTIVFLLVGIAWLGQFLHVKKSDHQ